MMNLYNVTCEFKGVLGVFAYWAESAIDAEHQALHDGATLAAAWETELTYKHEAQYNGPDFTGRKAWLVFDSAEGLRRYLQSGSEDAACLLYGIVADDYESAMAFDPEPFIGRRVCIVGFELELRLLEAGWDL